MNCCVNCFADKSLQSQIKAGSQNLGECDFCESTAIQIITCNELSERFESIFNLYVSSDSEESDLKDQNSSLLYHHLLNHWPGLFNSTILNEKSVKHLVNQIGRGWEGYSDILFSNKVEILPDLAEYPTGENQWDNFAREIKEENRFFLRENLDLENLEVILEKFSKTYKAGHVFYRARISPTPLSVSDLGKPPKERTRPSRANPVGIPYLYLSDKEKTTIYEARVGLHESISIGKFVLKSSLQVISLKDILHYGPFEIVDMDFDLKEYMAVRPYLIKLEGELAKPVRKDAINLDYLPTQYLCEYIKSLGYDAIEYRRTMIEDGYNLAVFNDRNVECVSVNHYEIKALEYDY